MDIRFVSSLTPDDEDRLASAVLSVVGSILDMLGVAYTLQVDTSGASVVRHSQAVASPSRTEMAAPSVPH